MVGADCCAGIIVAGMGRGFQTAIIADVYVRIELTLVDETR